MQNSGSECAEKIGTNYQVLMTVDDSTVNATTYLNRIVHNDQVKTSSANNLYDVFDYDTGASVYVMAFTDASNLTTTLSFSGIG